MDNAAEPAAAEEATASPEHVTVSVATLPPMPEPNQAEMSSQACGGVCCVTTLILGELAFAHLVVVMVGKPSLAVTVIFLAIMWGDAIWAVTCLLYILNGDPGVVSRCPEVCEPLPQQVKLRLEAGEPVTDIKENILDATTGQTFCVRCCVWRPKGGHHCRTCNRCVVKFDHHCGVFGRCIAGDQSWCADDAKQVIPGTQGVPGNMPYFNGILYSAGIATAANLIFFIISVVA